MDMYEARQNKEKVSRRIDGGRVIKRNNIAIQLTLNKYGTDKEARIGWINNKNVETVVVEDKFRDDHMLSTSTKVGKEKQEERGVKISSLIDANEDVPKLVKESSKNDDNTVSDIFNGMQQLSVKIEPKRGVKTIDNGSSKGLSKSEIVVKGNWIPEKGEMHVYHYDGNNFKNADKMKPEYMWCDGNKPKSQYDMYDALLKYFKDKECLKKEYHNKEECFNDIKNSGLKQFAELCHNKGILSFLPNSNNRLRLIYNRYHELF